MKRLQVRNTILIVGCLLALLSFPRVITEEMRSLAVASLTPTWRTLHSLKNSCLNLLLIAPPGSTPRGTDQMASVLEQENKLLRLQVENIKEWLQFEERIDEELERLQLINVQNPPDPFWKTYFKRRSKELGRSLEMQLQALPACVIFREPASWSSALWINVGKKDNEALGKTIVAKNSPVLLGSAILGVIEQVDQRKSRVRLITDSQLAPSVRALRGGEQNRFLIKSVETLLSALTLRDELFPTKQEAEHMFQSLSKLKERLIAPAADLYLGKGELHGTSSPLWRCRSHVLHGIGFNYDFADEEGRSRDLKDPLSLLRVGDLLVTTGMDGVFPAGFHVATISKIFPLQEGACSYELEAEAAAGRLDELTHVTVLPPLE